MGILSREHLKAAGLAAVLASVTLVAAEVAREALPDNDDNRKTCASNLKQIGLALRMYSSDWNERFPPPDGAAGLDILRQQGYLENTRMYGCPCARQHLAKDGKVLTEDTVDYVFLGGFSEADSVDFPVAYDKPGNHQDYINVLFIDGHVASYTGKEVAKILAEAKANHERVVGKRRAKDKVEPVGLE